MATWDELNKQAGGTATKTGGDFSSLSSWDEANKKAQEVRSQNIEIVDDALEGDDQQQPTETEEPEPQGFFGKAVDAAQTVGKFGLDALNWVNRTYEAGIDLAAEPLSNTRFIKEAARGLDAMEKGEVEFDNKAYIGKSILETLANPVKATLNTEKGTEIVTTVSEKSSNIPLKGLARISAIGDKTYEEAYAAWLAERNDPENPTWQKFLYELQDTGVQTSIGALLAVGTTVATRNPKAGYAVSGAFYTALSADEQIQERGEVESTGNIAIDVVGDQMLNRLLVGVLGNSSKGAITNALKGFGVEGSTEVAQSFLKFANDYGNARGEDEKQQVIANAKNYVTSGGMAMEFFVGGTVGAVLTGAAGAIPTGEGQPAPIPNQPTTRPAAEESDKEPPTSPVSFNVDGLDISEVRDKAAEFQNRYDSNDQADVAILTEMNDVLGDYARIFNDKSVYVPSDTVEAPLLEVETVEFPDGKFAVTYQANTETLRTASVNNFAETYDSKEAATEAALQQIREWAEQQNVNDPTKAADRQRILDTLENPRTPLPTEQEVTETGLNTDQLVDLRGNEEIYNLVTQDEQTSLQQIEEQVRSASPSLTAVQRAELAANVYDTIRDPQMTSIVRDLSIADVIEQNQRINERFQTEEQVEQERFEDVSRDDMRTVTEFMEDVRTGAEISQSDRDKVRALADRYGFREGATDAELARLMRLRVERSDRLSQLETSILSDISTEAETAAESAAQRERAAARKAEKVDEKMVKRLKREIPLLNEVPVEMVRNITTPSGRKAFGRFYQNTIQYTDDADVTTLPHESFHAYSQMALSTEEQTEMYNLAREAYGRPYASNHQIEETLAQDFANWYLDKRKKPAGFSQRLMEFFRKIADFIKQFTNKRTRKTLNDIFGDVISTGAAKRVKTAQQKALTPADIQSLRVEFFNDPEQFTLRLFGNDIFKKDRVGYQEVKQTIKSMSLKGGEQKLHELVLERPEFKEQKKFDAQEYISAVKSEMLQIRLQESGTYADYGLENIGVVGDGRVDDPADTAATYILNTNYEHGVTGHFGRDNASGLHSHFRAFIDRDANAFKVVEVQSDTYQRGLKPLTEEDIRAERQKGIEHVHSKVSREIESTDINLLTAEEMQGVVMDLATELRRYGIRSDDFKGYDNVKAVNKNVQTADQYMDALTKMMTAVEKQESRVVYGELTEEEQRRIKQSQQFDSMKNLWHEQNIRMAIREAAEKGTAYADFADTRTVAHVEGYVGEGGAQVERPQGFGEDIPINQAQVNDPMLYLGEFDAVVVETMHEDNTLGLVYSPSGVNVETARVEDLKSEETDRYRGDPNEFASRFYSEIKDDLPIKLRDEDAKKILQKVDDLTDEEVNQMTNSEVMSELESADPETVWTTIDENPELYTDEVRDFEESMLEGFERNFEAQEFFEDIYGNGTARTYFDKNNDVEYVAWVAGGELEYVEAPYGGNTVDGEFNLEDSVSDEGQANIAAKYGVNEINGKTREGEFYRYLKKSRPDLELVTDDNGFTWWRTAITDEDMNDVPLFQEDRRTVETTAPIDAKTRKAAELVSTVQKQALENDSFNELDSGIDEQLEQEMIAALKEAGYSNTWLEMQNDLVVYTTEKNKRTAGEKMVAMAQAVQGKDFPMQMLPDGSLVMYHGTTEENAQAILADQNETLFVSSAIEDVGGVNGAGYYGDSLLRLVVDPREVEFSATGEFSVNPEGIENVSRYSREFFQEAEPEPQESSIYEDLSNELERVISQLEAVLEIAGVSTRQNEDGSIVRVSSYPSWIPKHLRDKRLLEQVMEKVLKGENVTGSRQQEAYELIEDYILTELPSELANELVLNQYIQEQYEVADALRAETLAAMQRFVSDLDAKMKRSAKLRSKEVKKVIRTNTGQIRTDTREFSREMKKRARFFNRGYKTGYKQGARDKLYAMLARQRQKRDRKQQIEQLKRTYRRVRQATRTGSTLPIEYQQTLMEFFDAFDLTTMTAKTKKRLKGMQEYFERQEGDVPEDIAKKIGRLDKIPVGKLSDNALEQIINEVNRIFENGVTKKRLMDTRDANEFERVVRRVADSTVDLSRSGLSGFEGAAAKLGIPKISYKLYDPTRFADILDGSTQNYSGANFKELVEPVRLAIDRANIRTDSVTAEAFEEIEQFGEQFSDEEMARMMHTLALEQKADKQAETLAEFYKNERGYDFVSALTPKERGAIEVMKRYFKEIRPEVAGAYEQLNNIPFPDIDNYFPLRYDREKELFDINDQAFDFSITKTAQGFTIKRQPSVGRVLDINVFKTFANQMSSQVYYAEVQPQLDRTRSIINSPAYQSKLNRETQDYWKQFVEDVATRGRGTGDFIGKQTMDTLRGNVSASILGYKLSTIMIQPSAMFDSMIAIRQELGTRAVLEVLPRFLKMTFSPASLQAARERSVALANRAGGVLEIQEMRNATRGIFSDSPWRRGWHTFKSNAYAGIRFTDMRTAAAVFDTLVSGYEQKGLSREDATKRAEQMMMLSQSSANVAARPQVLNSASSRFFLPFQSFIINAFNNIRYDAVMREFKTRGRIRGTVNAISNMQFLAYAVAYEAIMYDMISKFFGYDDDDEEQGFTRKMFNSAIGRIPAIGFLVGFDGTFTGRFQVNNPALESIQDNLIALEGAATGELKIKEAYKAIKGMGILLGVPATQQIHQILTAPEIGGISGIGRELGIAYDPRLIVEKQRDAVLPLFSDTDNPEVTPETVEQLAEEVYGSDYTDADVDAKKRREDAIKKQIGVRKAFGFDDEFVNQAMERKNNNEVKATFIQLFDTFESPNAAITRYSRPIPVLGEPQRLMSEELTDQLRTIARLDPDDRERVLALTDPEITDAERREIIGDDRNFAFAAYKNVGVISKEFYESLAE